MLVIFPLFVIDPLGNFKKIWSYVMFVSFLYTFWVYPARLAFSYVSLTWNDAQDICDLIMDGIFMLDIVLRFFAAFEDKTGKLVYKRLEIMMAYIKTWFLFDFITTIPFYWLILQESQEEYIQKGTYLFIGNDQLKMLSLLRIFKLIRFYLHSKNIDLILLKVLKIKYQLFLILKFLSLIALTIHISACVWFFLCKMQSPEDLINGWIYVNNLQDPQYGIFEQYIASVYFIVAVLMSIGYGAPMVPQTNMEKTYFIVSVIFALGMFGFIMGMCLKLFGNKTSESFQFFMTIKQFVENFTENLHVSKILDWKMLFYFRKSMQFQNNILHSYHDMKLLPLELQHEVVSFILSDFLEKFDFFVDKPKSFVVNFVRNLRPAFYSAGDEIYKQGDPSFFLYFVQKGRVVTCCEDHLGRERAQIYMEGTYFGEVDIIMNQERLDNCYAETELKLLKMHKSKLLKIFKDYEGIKEEMTELAKKRLEIHKTSRKPKSLNTNILPRSYWIWRKNKDCFEASIEDAHLSQRRSTIRKSILEGSATVRSRGSSPMSFKSMNSMHRNRKATYVNIMKLIGTPIEDDVEIEEGEVESISKEKLAGMMKEESNLGSNRNEIIQAFECLEDRDRMKEKKKKMSPIGELDAIIESAREINDVLKLMLEDQES